MREMITNCLCLLAVFAGIVAAPWATAAEPLNLGSRLEPIVDDSLFASLDGTELRLQHPQAGETVLTFDKPWEGRFSGYGTIIVDDGLYRLYYRGLPEALADGSTLETTCYAESTDGIHFEKPNLGIFEVLGTRENNAILADMAPFSHNFAPFLDTRPGVEPAHRYKALAGTSQTGLVGFVSEDGLHWSKLREEPLITDGAFDSQNVAFWSETEGQYLCYLRTFVDGFRWIARTTSEDFVNWTEVKNMNFGDVPSEHLYTNQTMPYFRAPHIYVGTAARFMPGRRVVSSEAFAEWGGEGPYANDCSDSVLLTSRGGYDYDRTFMEGFVRPGPGLQNWTSRTNYPARGIVPTGEYEMSMYVQRHYGQPDHSLQRMILRTDGFASIHASYDGGEATTVPVVFDGDELVVNFATSAAGSVKVEVLDANGAPLAGFTRDEADELVGDAIEHAVTWSGSGDISAWAGQPVQLRFIMKDADVYALRSR